MTALPPEPPHGSVVLRYGATGTAYQRHFNDGLWHAAGREAMTWRELHGDPMPPILIYAAPES